MLIHALVLSLLLSLPTATLTLAFSGELSAVAWACAVVSSLACCICAFGETCVLSAEVNGRVARAAYRPTLVNRVIEHELPVLPVSPVSLPPERLRFIPVKTASSYPSVPLQRSAKFSATPIAPPPHLETPTSHGVPTCDLIAFVNSLSTKGSHSRRAHEGKVLPSGRVIDAEYHALLCEPLVSCGAITGRAPRKAGSLVMTPIEILECLELV